MKQSPEAWHSSTLDEREAPDKDGDYPNDAGAQTVKICCGPSDDAPTPAPEEHKISDPLEFGV